MSLKYTVLKRVFRILGMQKRMARPYSELVRMFGSDRAALKIPVLKKKGYETETVTVSDHPVLLIRHRKKVQSLLVFVVGGGMLEYPERSQVKSALKLAEKTGRDVAVPFFPLAPEYNLFDALDMLLETYRKMLSLYDSDDIAFLGGSSGAFMTLCLMSYINEGKKNLPLPGKLYLSSPGSALTAEERKTAEEKNGSDLIMSTAALDNIFSGMAGGRILPDWMMYMQRGNYTSLRSAYLSYGGDEVFSAAAASTAGRLRSFGTDVTLEVGEGMYHMYAALPLVREAEGAYERMIGYLKV